MPARLVCAARHFRPDDFYNPVFNAHVHAYAALKNRILRCQARNAYSAASTAASIAWLRAGVSPSSKDKTPCPEGKKINNSIFEYPPTPVWGHKIQQKKGASLSACPHLSIRQISFTALALQPPAVPAQGHGRAKAALPRRRPCQTAACPRACHFPRRAPQAWKARADLPD